MNAHKRTELEDLLRSGPDPEPPPELIDRILEEIPDSLPRPVLAELGEGGEDTSAAARERGRPRWLLLAASITVLIGAGWMTVQLRQSGIAPEAMTLPATVGPTESPDAELHAAQPNEAQRSGAPDSSARLRRTESAADAPVAGRSTSEVIAVEESIAEPIVSAQTGRDQDTSRGNVGGPRQGLPAGVAKEPEPLQKTSPSEFEGISAPSDQRLTDAAPRRSRRPARVPLPDPTPELPEAESRGDRTGQGVGRQQGVAQQRFAAPSAPPATAIAEPSLGIDQSGQAETQHTRPQGPARPKAAATPPGEAAASGGGKQKVELKKEAELTQSVPLTSSVQSDVVAQGQRSRRVINSKKLKPEPAIEHYDQQAAVEEKRLWLPDAEADTRLASRRENLAKSAADRLFAEATTVRIDLPPNPFVDAEEDALSTFGLDVDTASYTAVRGYLWSGRLPPASLVRVEEMLNYFDYGDAPPSRGDFALRAEVAPSPFATPVSSAQGGDRMVLLRLAIKARELSASQRRPADLTLVVDTSGSMAKGNRLDMVKESLRLLLAQLGPDDRVALVTYGNEARLELAHTSDFTAVRQALDRLRPKGSTFVEGGLTMAYEITARNRRPGAIGRVILCSDGVANVGRTDPQGILERVQREADSGVELTTLGFGMGDYNDVLMEQLADRGNGRYAYVDTVREARRLFVDALTGTLQSVAAEARAQLEVNPQLVRRYRLIGYENRDLADHRFRDDTADGGEIGAGHAITVLYELQLREQPRRNQRLATLHLRYGSIDRGQMVEQRQEIRGRDLHRSFSEASPAFRLSAAVAQLAELLRGSSRARAGAAREVYEAARQAAQHYPDQVDIAELVAVAGRTAELLEQLQGEAGE